MSGKMNGAPVATVCSQFKIALYKKPSIFCGFGTSGCRNMGSFSNSPYSNSKKLL